MNKIESLKKIYHDLHDIRYLSNAQLFQYYHKVVHILTHDSTLFIVVKHTRKTNDMLVTTYFTFNTLNDIQVQKQHHIFYLIKALNIPLRELHNHFCQHTHKNKYTLVNTAMLMHTTLIDIHFLVKHAEDVVHEKSHANNISRKVYDNLDKYLDSPQARQEFCQNYPKVLAPIVDSYRHILEARIYNYYQQVGNNVLSYQRDRLIIYRYKRILRQDHGSYLLGNICYGTISPSSSIHNIKLTQLPQLKINFCSYLINNKRFGDLYNINRAKFLIKNRQSFWYISKKTDVNKNLLKSIKAGKAKFSKLSIRDIDNLSKYYMSTHQDHVLDKNNNAKNAHEC